jgi:hypothetical protein
MESGWCKPWAIVLAKRQEDHVKGKSMVFEAMGIQCGLLRLDM